MRHPFGVGAYDYVFNLFTSFGYFEDSAEHLAVIRNMADALQAGGTLVLDYLNVRYAETHLVPSETKTIDGARYQIARWSDAKAFFKRITVDDPDNVRPLEQVERVAKLSRSDFEWMFAVAGLRLEAVYGDYGLNPYDVLESPRMILIATRVVRSAVAAQLREELPRAS
jgi:hypothetical protein